ncbi:MAG: diguanylate cyclase, partial [Acidimicrobiia bacterium]|nr:diguanylate cyclase [Acidimicrobiia bacterium]
SRPAVAAVGGATALVVAGIVLTLGLERRRLVRAVLGTQAEAAQLDQRFRLAFHGAPVGIAIVDRDGNIVKANEALLILLGRPSMPHRSLAESALPEDVAVVGENFRRLINGEVDHVVHERQLRRADGSLVWVRIHSAPLPGPDGTPAAIVGHIVDITAEREAVAAVDELRHRAFHDNLTGLATRDVLLDRLGGALGRARRSGEAVAVLYLDLDRFKSVNDRFGHATGDALLRWVAGAISGAVRPGDTVARHGGDEFVVLLDPVTGVPEARIVARRIRDALTRPVELAGGVRLAVAASVGIAVSLGYAAPEDLLRDADAALYHAKTGGRDRVEVFDDELRARAVRRLSTELVLRQALDDGSITLRFEPVADLHTGRVVGAEARIQLTQPSGESVPVAELRLVAQETGLALTLGAGAIDGACRAAAAWKRTDGDRCWVGIDVTPQEVVHPTFVDRLSRSIEESGVEPGSVRLELPESVCEQRGPARRALDMVRSLGVLVVLDGFGADLRSFARLGSMPIDGLKLDLAWFPDVVSDRVAAALLGALLPVTELAALPVVITGADQAGQIEVVRSIGYRYVQGGAVAPGLAVEDLVSLAG